eukprot:362860-Chlamydomonas_euryale.AAC.15
MAERGGLKRRRASPSNHRSGCSRPRWTRGRERREPGHWPYRDGCPTCGPALQGFALRSDARASAALSRSGSNPPPRNTTLPPAATTCHCQLPRSAAAPARTCRVKHGLSPDRHQAATGLPSQLPGLRSQLPESRSQNPRLRSQLPELRSQNPGPRSQLQVLSSQLPESHPQLTGLRSQLPRLPSLLPASRSQLPGRRSQLPVLSHRLPVLTSQVAFTQALPASSHHLSCTLHNLQLIPLALPPPFHPAIKP